MAQWQPLGETMMYLLFFAAGAALGIAGHKSWSEAMVLLAKNTAAKEQEELFAEIKRLRTQVAAHIGTEK